MKLLMWQHCYWWFWENICRASWGSHSADCLLQANAGHLSLSQLQHATSSSHITSSNVSVGRRKKGKQLNRIPLPLPLSSSPRLPGVYVATLPLLCNFCLHDFPSKKVPMMHGGTPGTVSAATTSATSVPFATASANQVCTSTTSLTLSLYLSPSIYLSITHPFLSMHLNDLGMLVS